MDRKIAKLNDDELANVSGGTRGEISELCKALNIPGLAETSPKIEKSLKLLGIGLHVSVDGLISNRYYDLKTGKSMEHKEVLAKIQQNK